MLEERRKKERQCRLEEKTVLSVSKLPPIKQWDAEYKLYTTLVKDIILKSSELLS